MKTKLLACTLVGSCAALAVSALAFAEPTSNTPEPHPMASPWQWTEEKWSGDEEAYQKLRTTVDDNKAVGKLTLETIERYKILHEKKPSDTLALFQWSYASFQATQSNPPISQKQLPAPHIFEEAPSPHTYEYDRLRFLVWAHYTPDARLQTVGERLLRHTSNDYDVEYYLTQCYNPGHSVLEKQKAVSLAQRLVRVAPGRPGSYSALGGVYFNSWMVRAYLINA